MPRNPVKKLTEAVSILSKVEESVKSLENSQRTTLRKLEEILQTQESLGTALNAFSLESSELSQEIEHLGELHDESASHFADLILAQHRINEAIHEMILYFAAIKTAVKNFSCKQVEYEILAEKTARSRSELLQVSVSGSPGEAQRNLQSLEESEEITRRELELLQGSLVSEVEIWLIRLRSVWHSILSQLATAHKELAESGIECWQWS